MKTVVVLGAGASKDFGLPTGPELNTDIAASLAMTIDDWSGGAWKDQDIGGAFSDWPGRSPQAMFDACNRIARSIEFHQSPDDFLYAFGEDDAVVEAGKAGIVTSILRRERDSWLCKAAARDRNTAGLLREQRNSWPLKLLGLRAPGKRVSEVMDLFKDVAFVNFNYDRCLEQSLYLGLQAALGIDEVKAAEVVKEITILHPYGTVAPLPWQVARGGIGFGARPTQRLYELAANVHTLTEDHHTDEDRARIRSHMAAADSIIFLGFGFHKQNMKLLNPGISNSAWQPRIWATACKTSPSQRGVFQSRLGDFCQASIYVRPTLSELSCDEFMAAFGQEIFG